MGILSDWQIERDVKITPFAKYDRQEQLGKVSWGVGSYGYDARIGYKFRVFKPFVPGCSNPVIDPLDFNPGLLEEVDYSPLCHECVHLGSIQNRLHYTYECRHCQTGTDTPEPMNVLSCPARFQPPNHILIPPHSFVLGETVEHFDIPRDVLCVVVGKSTYARCGLVVNVTPGEPEWRGKWTVEVSNTTPLPAKVYCGQGIMQCMFFRSDGRDESVGSVVAQMLAESGRKDELYQQLHADVTCRVSYADKKGKYQDQKGLTNPTVTKEDK